MECETEFAPSPLWSDASICAQAFNMLQNTHDSFETLGVRHALFFGTLLGAIRHGGPVMRFAYDRRCLFVSHPISLSLSILFSMQWRACVDDSHLTMHNRYHGTTTLK